MTNTPKECRAGRKCEPRTRKEAVDCLAHHSALSLPQMCERSGLDYNAIAKKCSLYEKRGPSYEEIDVLTANSADDPKERNLVAIRFLARQHGCALVMLPTAQADQDDAFFGAMTAATERLSHIGREIHEALRGDNEIDEDEEQRILGRTHAMHEQIATVEELVKARRRTRRALRDVTRREA